MIQLTIIDILPRMLKNNSMYFFKKIWRIMRLVCFIVLATVGVGLGGGVPISISHKKEDTPLVKIELVEDSEEEEDEESENELQ